MAAGPPSLAGPLARIDRAAELLGDLDAAIAAFLDTRPYVIEEVPDANPTTRAFALRDVYAVPERPRIIAGRSRPAVAIGRYTCRGLSPRPFEDTVRCVRRAHYQTVRVHCRRVAKTVEELRLGPAER